MSEPSFKRRLRERKRSITTTLEAQGYRVRTFDDGPFHLFACRGKTARAIRISFNAVCHSESELVKREAVPERCLREIWAVSADGRDVNVLRIGGER